MLFYSLPYIVFFLPLVIITIYSLKLIKLDPKIILILFSIFFYSWWNIYYLPVIIVSILINYISYKAIISSKDKKKKYLLIGVSLNVILLLLFKYLDFIILNFNLLFSLDVSLLNLPFPLAISFFTFQSINFLVNVYDEEIISVKFKEFFLFIIFFPQLIAGPIVKYNYMMPQFNSEKNLYFSKKNFSIGLIIFFIGFIKKIYFADTLAGFVDLKFNNLDELNFLSSWFLSTAFTFQFYFDFSGYVDMATGSALMLNISLPQNFNSPLKSISIINFWQRWHITLTNFLTHIIYNPLLRSFKKINFFNSMLVTFIVFLIAGIWHGPAWNFVFFGCLHGIGLIINHLYRKYSIYDLPKYVSWFLTFNFVNITFIFFRSNEVNEAIKILRNMFNIQDLLKLDYSFEKVFLNVSNNIEFYICFIFSLFICFCFKNSYELIKEKNESTY